MPTVLDDFTRFYAQQLMVGDCDPGILALQYLVRRQELNEDQQVWLCWLYANTYNVATAWVIFNEYPDYENVDQHRLDAFNQASRGRLPYQKDQKWLRGQLAPVYASLRRVCGPSIGKHWWQFLGDFPGAWASAMSIYKVGRYTAWMFLQALNEVCNLCLVPPTLELGHDSARMHREGLALAAGRPEWVEEGYTFSPAALEYLEEVGTEVLTRVKLIHTGAVRADRFSMETSLCAFRKLFRREQGRYLGFYLDRWARDIRAVEEQGWTGINWALLWECRDEELPPALNRPDGILHKEFYGLYLDSGEFLPPSPFRDTLNKLYYDSI